MVMTEENNRSNKSESIDNGVMATPQPILISEALIIALIPIFAYILSFAYETASAKYLGIPPNYISLNFIDILKLGKQLVLSFSMGLFIFWFAFFLSKIPWEGWKITSFIILGIFIAVIYYFSRRIVLSECIRWIIVLVAIVGTLTMVYIKKTNVYKLYESITHLSVLNLVLSCITMILIAYGQGHIETKEWKPFYVIVKEVQTNAQGKVAIQQVNPQAVRRKSVVLKMYGDLVIYADVENDTIKNYTLSKYCDIKNFTVHRETLSNIVVPKVK